jgi:hypothetical protein
MSAWKVPSERELATARAEWGEAVQDLLSLRKVLLRGDAPDPELQRRAGAAEERLRQATLRLSRLMSEEDGRKP